MTLRAIVWTLVAASVPTAAAAQDIFKCFDNSSVTYTNTPCEKLGLKPGGEIRNLLTTVPAFKPKPPARPPAPAAQKDVSTAKSDNAVEMPRSATVKPVKPVKPVNPLIDKLTR